MWSRLLSIVSGILHRSRVDKDAAHAARGLAWFDWLRQDVRHTARMLRRSPMFAA